MRLNSKEEIWIPGALLSNRESLISWRDVIEYLFSLCTGSYYVVDGDGSTMMERVESYMQSRESGLALMGLMDEDYGRETSTVNRNSPIDLLFQNERLVMLMSEYV